MMLKLVFISLLDKVSLTLWLTLRSVLVHILQHLVTRYGDHFLQSIQKLSKQLDLALDGVAAIEVTQALNNCKAYTTPKQPKDLPPAKYSAWKMWQEDGLSTEQIAVCLSY